MEQSDAYSYGNKSYGYVCLNINMNSDQISDKTMDKKEISSLLQHSN